MTYYNYSNPAELYHHGILGMKWGVRRYQNEDGTLTSAGRQRYLNAKSEYKKAKNEYSRAFDSANTYSGRHYISQYTNKSRREESNKRWGDVIDKLHSLDAAKKEYKEAKRDYKKESALTPEERKARTQKALKVGAAVAGTALAAYGTYKLAEYVRDKRNENAMNEAKSFVDAHFFQKRGVSEYADGSIGYYFQNGRGDHISTYGSRDIAGKGVGRLNSKIIATGQKIYEDKLNNPIDKSLNRFVEAGSKVVNPAEQAVKRAGTYAKNKAADAGKYVKNRVLDVVDPVYEMTPHTDRIQKTIGGMNFEGTETYYTRGPKKRRT